MANVKRVVLRKTGRGRKILVYRHAGRGGMYVSAWESVAENEKPSAAVARLDAAKKLS